MTISVTKANPGAICAIQNCGKPAVVELSAPLVIHSWGTHNVDGKLPLCQADRDAILAQLNASALPDMTDSRVPEDQT